MRMQRIGAPWSGFSVWPNPRSNKGEFGKEGGPPPRYTCCAREEGQSLRLRPQAHARPLAPNLPPQPRTAHAASSAPLLAPQGPRQGQEEAEQVAWSRRSPPPHPHPHPHLPPASPSSRRTPRRPSPCTASGSSRSSFLRALQAGRTPSRRPPSTPRPLPPRILPRPRSRAPAAARRRWQGRGRRLPLVWRQQPPFPPAISALGRWRWRPLLRRSCRAAPLAPVRARAPGGTCCRARAAQSGPAAAPLGRRPSRAARGRPPHLAVGGGGGAGAHLCPFCSPWRHPQRRSLTTSHLQATCRGSVRVCPALYQSMLLHRVSAKANEKHLFPQILRVLTEEDWLSSQRRRA